MSYTYSYKKTEDCNLQKILLDIKSFLNSLSCNSSYMLLAKFKKAFPYKVIGVGGCAFVVQISKTQVVRVESLDVESGYLKWLKYVLKNQNLKCVPKIFAAFKFIPDFGYFASGRNPGFLVSVSELLIPLSKAKVLKNYKNASSELMKWFLEKSKEEDHHLLESFKKKVKLEHMAVFRPKEYIKIKSEVKGINDIFYKNVMVSLNSRRLVITDPIS